jgi:hypothetical protein
MRGDVVMGIGEAIIRTTTVNLREWRYCTRLLLPPVMQVK